MDRLRESLGIINDSVKRRLNKVKLLKGKRFDTFIDILNLPGDTVIYFNNFNIAIIDPRIHELMLPYLSGKQLKFTMQDTEMNSHIWIYQYMGDQLLEDYLLWILPQKIGYFLEVNIS